MIAYDYLTQPEKLEILVKLIRGGFFKDSTIITHIRIYEDFLKHPSPKKMKRYKDLAEKYKLSSKTIERIIRKLNKKI